MLFNVPTDNGLGFSSLTSTEVEAATVTSEMPEVHEGNNAGSSTLSSKDSKVTSPIIFSLFYNCVCSLDKID